MTAPFQINEPVVRLERIYRRSNAKSASDKFKAMAQKRLKLKQVKKHKLNVVKKKRQTDRLFDRTVQQASLQEINNLTLICNYCGSCHNDMSTGRCQCDDYHYYNDDCNGYDDDSDYFPVNYDSDDERAYGYYLHQHLRSSKDDDRTYGYYMQQHLRSSKTVDHYDPFDWRN
jgi:hypothetical protein